MKSQQLSLPPRTRPPRPGYELALVHGVFIASGIVTTLLGPMLPVLSARWSLGDRQAGYLFTAQFLSSMAGVVLSSLLAQRCGYRVVMAIGAAAMAAGAAVLAHASSSSPPSATLSVSSGISWLAGLVSVCIYGLGIGITSPTANLAVAALNPSHRAAALNLLNFSWGLGAVACPFAVAFLVLAQRAPLFLYGVAAALTLLALGFALMPPAETSDSPAARTLAPAARLRRQPLLFILGALFFLYVGAESSIGGWLATYTQRMHLTAGAFWALTPSFFWSALLLGRALAPGILRVVEEKRLATAGLVVSALGIACLLAAHTMAAVSLGAAIAGLGFSSVFPACIAVLSARFGDLASRAAGILFALAGLGGATLPNLVGVLSSRLNSLRAGLSVPLFGCVLMLWLFAWLSRKPGVRSLARRRVVRPPVTA